MVRSFGGKEPHERGDAMTTRKPELPIIPFASREAWLEEHHGTSDGLWLKLAK
jgi:hypothetical protein